MSISVCIEGLIAEGALKQGEGAAAEAHYSRYYHGLKHSMSPMAAAEKASQMAIKAVKAESFEARRRAVLMIDAQQRALASMALFDGPKGAAALALLDHDGRAPYMNVSILSEAIRGRAHSKIEALLSTFSRDILGNMRHPAEMQHLRMELFGEDSGNAAAKEMAAAWTGATEELRQRFNAAGGHIGKLERWGLPQSHDMGRVRTAGFTEWRAFLLGGGADGKSLLKRDVMIDWRTGLPLDDARLDETLRTAFDNISTDGAIGRQTGDGTASAGQGQSLANSRADHRFMHFADAASWEAYADRFGSGASVFDTMMGHIDGMARDNAHMELLGPNPNATISWLQRQILDDANINGDNVNFLGGGTARDYAHALEKLYGVTSGKSSIPVNEVWARRLASTRSLITSAKLGSAIFSSLDDVGKMAITRAFNGLPQTAVIFDHAKALIGENPKIAIRMGLIASEAGRQAAGLSRRLGESMGHGVSGRLADGVLRLSGLQAWTQAGKWAFGMEFLGHLAHEGVKELGALHPALGGALERYGITAREWDHIRSAQRFEYGGADWIDPQAIDQPISDKLMQMILTETSYAVPEVSARARAITTFGQPGTLAGEASRSMFQFKGFATSMVLTHGRRAVAGNGQPFSRSGYAAAMVGTTMLMGALATQMKSVAKGIDPEPMDDPRFWARAELQGGGLGIFGDYMQTELQQALQGGAGASRTGSLAEAVAGPLIGLAHDSGTLATKGVMFAADAARFGFDSAESETSQGQFAEASARFVRGYTPASSLWYTRAAFDHYVVDTISRWGDPNYDDHLRALEQADEAKGVGRWWGHDEALPTRAPDFSNALNAPPEE